MATDAALLLSALRGLEGSGAAAIVRFSDGDAYLVEIVSTMHAEEGGDVVADVLQVISAPAGGGIPAGACMNFFLADVAEVTVAGRRVFPDTNAEPAVAPDGAGRGGS